MSGRISSSRSLGGLLFASMFVLSVVVAAAPPAGAAATPCHWSVVPNHRPPGTTGTLEGVAALSATDAWAVGSVQTSRRALPLAEHWDGTAWRVAPTPVDGRHIRVLHDVSAVSASDVWAVGTQIALGSGAVHPLVEHWNGSTWAVVRDPRTQGARAELFAVSAASPTNVWAVGYREPGFTPGPFVAHWNGTRWHVFAAPTGTMLFDVAARYSGAVWTVGTNPFGIDHALLARRTGMGWQATDVPPRALTAISWRRPFEAWAVGYKPGSTGGPLQPLALRWNGHTWSVTPAPELHGSGELRGVAGISPNRAWAVGTRNFRHPLLMHWNGSGWKVVFGPDVDGFLDDVARVPGSHELWAVGRGTPDPLIMRYC
jgi:hypothetical protein